jgi:SAM-dependent methyltransferase
MEQIKNHSNIPLLSLPKRSLVIFLRAFFTLLYHQLAWTYDLVASIVSLGAWQRWIFSVLPYLDDSRTLELGFGPGHLQLALHQKGISVYGLDESYQMGQIAHKRFTRLGLFANLVRGQAQILPFAGESFHQVVMTFPAEFILNQQTLIEVHRVLIRGGKAVILPLAWITGRKPLERAIAWLNRITGEAPEWDEVSLEPLKKLGFDICWEMIDNGTSKILIIQLTKPLNR